MIADLLKEIISEVSLELELDLTGDVVHCDSVLTDGDDMQAIDDDDIEDLSIIEGTRLVEYNHVFH